MRIISVHFMTSSHRLRMRIWCVTFERASCLSCCLYNGAIPLDGLLCGTGPLAPLFYSTS